MKKLIALSRCLLLTALAGCSILVPPGARFTAEQNAFITPGVTHRDDVIRTLGEPKADFPDLRIIVYARVMEGKRTLLDHLVGYHPYVTTQLFLIVFDPNDRVIKFETIRPQLNIPLRHRALKWAEHEGWPIPKRPTTFVAQEIPPGKSVLYIYRPTGEEAWGLPGIIGPPSDVFLDGRVVADLRFGTYFSIVLAPGPHYVDVGPGSHGPACGWRAFSLEALPDSAHFVTAALEGICTTLALHAEEEALPVLKGMKPSP